MVVHLAPAAAPPHTKQILVKICPKLKIFKEYNSDMTFWDTWNFGNLPQTKILNLEKGAQNMPTFI